MPRNIPFFLFTNHYPSPQYVPPLAVAHLRPLVSPATPQAPTPNPTPAIQVGSQMTLVPLIPLAAPLTPPDFLVSDFIFPPAQTPPHSLATCTEHSYPPLSPYYTPELPTSLHRVHFSPPPLHPLPTPPVCLVCSTLALLFLPCTVVGRLHALLTEQSNLADLLSSGYSTSRGVAYHVVCSFCKLEVCQATPYTCEMAWI